jgi:hypothetical protein
VSDRDSPAEGIQNRIICALKPALLAQLLSRAEPAIRNRRSV